MVPDANSPILVSFGFGECPPKGLFGEGLLESLSFHILAKCYSGMPAVGSSYNTSSTCLSGHHGPLDSCRLIHFWCLQHLQPKMRSFSLALCVRSFFLSPVIDCIPFPVIFIKESFLALLCGKPLVLYVYVLGTRQRSHPS